MDFRGVLHCLGWTVIIFAGGMMLASVGGFIMREYTAGWIYAQSAILIGFIGGALTLSTRQLRGNFEKRECILYVAMVWPLLAVLGSIPLYWSEPAMGEFASVFEAVSGITTTGATVLAAPEEVARTTLLWRALLQWQGGFLTIVLVVVVMSHLNIGGLEIFQKVVPSGEGAAIPNRLAQTAKDLALVYTLFTALCGFALWFAGMPGFDAFCHALSTLSTGGFSTHSDGVANFANPLIETTLIVFMFVGSLNFTLHWGLVQGRWWVYGRNRELKYLIYILIVSLPVVAFLALNDSHVGVLREMRAGLFVIVSMLSTTGYVSTYDLSSLGYPVVLVAFLVMVGGATGSTAGGLKLLRIAVLIKQSIRELRRLTHLHVVVGVRFGRQRLGEHAIGSVWAFFFVFILCLAALTIALAFVGMPVEAAMLAAVSALSNAGPALNVLDPAGYVDLSKSAQIWLCLGMIFGRVELLALFTLLNPSYWRG